MATLQDYLLKEMIPKDENHLGQDIIVTIQVQEQRQGIGLVECGLKNQFQRLLKVKNN